MKNLFLIAAFCVALYSCGTGNKAINSSSENTKKDTVRIANDSLEYEILIIEPGFESWLVSQPPRGFYSQSLLESKNQSFVSEYNNRVLQPAQIFP